MDASVRLSQTAPSLTTRTTRTLGGVVGTSEEAAMPIAGVGDSTNFLPEPRVAGSIASKSGRGARSPPSQRTGWWRRPRLRLLRGRAPCRRPLPRRGPPPRGGLPPSRGLASCCLPCGGLPPRSGCRLLPRGGLLSGGRLLTRCWHPSPPFAAQDAIRFRRRRSRSLIPPHTPYR